MSSFRVVLATAILAVAGPAASAAAAYEVFRTEVAGRERVARIFPGEQGTGAAPLLLVFHGRGDREGNFARAVRLHRDWPEAVVIYPRGERVAHENNQRGWLGGDVEDVNDDMTFVRKLLDHARQHYRIDPCRVYAAGFSNGGRFVFVLMTEMPEPFAAWVSIGAVSEYIARARQPQPVLYLFGQFEPKKYQDAWRGTVRLLAGLNGATGERERWAAGLTRFVPADGGAETVYGLYEAGHQWPRGLNDEMIRFLSAHRCCPES